MKRFLPLMLALAVAACGSESDNSPAATPAPQAPVASEPAPPAPVVDDAAVEETAVAEPDAAPAEAELDAAATDTPTEAETPAPEAPATPAAPVAPPAAALDPSRAPRLGRDYTVLPEPQPTFGQGGIEVAEVFAYTCSHCANLQPAINTWKPALASDVRFTYIPGAFGGVGDNFARAYFAAETMGIADKTHDEMFQAVLVQRAFQTASLEELADWYAKHGVDRDAFLSTMNSFAITAKVNRARQFALRTNVDATPTVIINGKYRATMTGDRGPQGLLDTIDYLVAQERAQAAP
jgi:thiol:disulfide interchange protein DsbA